MSGQTRVKLIGEDPELDRVESAVKAASFPFSRLKDLDDACEAQSEEPAELFVLGPSLYFQSHLNQIQKLANRPEVVLASGPRLPNLAKILVPKLVSSDWSDEEIAWELGLALDFHRRSRRLEALRDHHKRSVHSDANPAVQLITNLMKKCTAATECKDLLASVLSLRSVIDFHDASLLVMDGEHQPLEAWHSSKERKDALKETSVASAGLSLADFPEGEVKLLSSSSQGSSGFDSLAFHPWSFGLALRFSVGQNQKKSKTSRSALLVLFRRELVPFVERDLWLLELTYGPLTLALEKVAMLKAIGLASKEWRSTFDGISEPLTVVDLNYQIVKANKSFAKMVGQDIKKLKGRRCYSLLAGRRTPCVGCPIGADSPPHSGSRVQLLGKSKRDLLVWSYGIRTGLDSYHFQFYRNVSTETMLTSTLIQSEKMAALGRLVGAVAHEINNPLAGILATSQILLTDPPPGGLDDSVKEDIEEIRSAALRSKKIIDDLLGFTSYGKSDLQKADLVEVVKSTLTFSKSATKDVAIKLEADGDNSVVAQVSLVQQILFNLITNAVQAMNGKGSLLLKVATGESWSRIHVRDSGPGIPPDRLKLIFDPFHTSKQEGAGTGLGLSIVRNLTQKIGARIEVSSVVGSGTEFVLYLPRTPATGKAGAD